MDRKWQLADGRVFSEPDERKAIQRFCDMTDARVSGTFLGMKIEAKRSEMMALRDQVDEVIHEGETDFRYPLLTGWL